jgi:hypothetical protein
MSHTLVAIAETPAACKWSHVGFRQSGLPAYAVPAPPMWICVRDASAPRPVMEADCDGCPHWERDPGNPIVE